MTRTPDEIKKGLELCYEGIDCSECPYFMDCFRDDETPYGAVMPDALAYIQQLEATVSEKEKVVAELSGKIGRLEADNKLLQDAVDQWEYVAASPGAVEDMARENDMLTKYARQREKQVTELSASNVKLQKEVYQLKAERDAAVADLAHVKDCDTCKYDNACLTGKKDCFACHEKSCPCLICRYEWRGVQKEE